MWMMMWDETDTFRCVNMECKVVQKFDRGLRIWCYIWHVCIIGAELDLYWQISFPKIKKISKAYMCVGATKGTYRRDIKMIVNHDYMKQCIIFAKNFLGWLYYQILFTFHSTNFCMHLYTSMHQFRLFCVCMLLVPYFLVNLIRF